MGSVNQYRSQNDHSMTPINSSMVRNIFVLHASQVSTDVIVSAFQLLPFSSSPSTGCTDWSLPPSKYSHHCSCPASTTLTQMLSGNTLQFLRRCATGNVPKFYCTSLNHSKHKQCCSFNSTMCS